MTRIASGFAVAAAFGFAVTVGAQTTTTATGGQRSPSADAKPVNEITITGCLSKGADGNYALTNARVEPAGSASATTTAGEATTTAGTTTTATTTTTAGTTTAGTTTTGTSGTTMSAAGATWALSGSDLDKHVGHKIQVTGRAVSNSPDTTSSTATATATGTTGGAPAAAAAASASQPKLDVSTIKMIAASCS